MRIPLRYLIAGLLAAGLLVWIAVAQAPDGRLHVIILDVAGGQGLLRTPAGRFVLIDGGASPNRLLSALGRHLPFWEHSLSYVVASSTSDGNLLASIDVLTRYQAQAALAPAAPTVPAPAYSRWRAVLAERRIPITEARPGTEIDMADGVHLQVAGESKGSISLRLTYGDFSLSLPGSAVPSPAEADAPVVALPTSSEQAVNTVVPEPAVVIMLNGSKRSKPLLRPVSGRIYSTAEQGSIEISSDGRSFTIRPLR